MTPAIFGIAGAKLTAEERAFFKEADPAGYILFGRNCVDPQQLRGLTDDLRSIQSTCEQAVVTFPPKRLSSSVHPRKTDALTEQVAA